MESIRPKKKPILECISTTVRMEEAKRLCISWAMSLREVSRMGYSKVWASSTSPMGTTMLENSMVDSETARAPSSLQTGMNTKESGSITIRMATES